jgi:hypothetical protein
LIFGLLPATPFALAGVRLGVFFTPFFAVLACGDFSPAACSTVAAAAVIAACCSATIGDTAAANDPTRGCEMIQQI